MKRRDLLATFWWLATAGITHGCARTSGLAGGPAATPDVEPGQRPAARGFHLSIGVNRVSVAHYTGWPGTLKYAESDADAIDQMLRARSFTSTGELRGRDARRSKVQQAILELTSIARPGDLACVYYAGHGSQVPDRNGDEQPNRDDQTWCLYDGQLVDDELHELLGHFAAGVRVLVISDSCKSGTIIKKRAGSLSAVLFPMLHDVRSRDMPRALADRVYANNKQFYDDLQANISPRSLKTRIELLAACDMQELAYEEDGHGRFTQALLRACQRGCQLTYAEMFDLARKRMQSSGQIPRRYGIGPVMDWFDTEAAFVV
jgi:hypothetical protein